MFEMGVKVTKLNEPLLSLERKMRRADLIVKCLRFTQFASHGIDVLLNLINVETEW